MAVAVDTKQEDQTDERPTQTITIGAREYTARSPKLKVWMDMATLIEQAQGNRADRRAGLEFDRVILTAVLSRFLSACLSKADAAALDAELDDSDTDLDLPDIWAAGITLANAFAPDMQRRAEAMGLRVPKLVEQLNAAGSPPPAAASVSRGRGKTAVKKSTGAKRR